MRLMSISSDFLLVSSYQTVLCLHCCYISISYYVMIKCFFSLHHKETRLVVRLQKFH